MGPVWDLHLIPQACGQSSHAGELPALRAEHEMDAGEEFGANAGVAVCGMTGEMGRSLKASVKPSLPNAPQNAYQLQAPQRRLHGRGKANLPKSKRRLQ